MTAAGEPPPEGVSVARESLPTARANLPVGFRVSDERDQLTLVKEHGSRGGWVSIGVGVVLGVGAGAADMPSVVAVGLGLGCLILLYNGVRAWTNRPRLIASRSGVRIVERPLPWPGRGLPREDLNDLRVERDDSYQINKVPVEQYRLVVDQPPKIRTLLAGIRTREQAEWMASRIRQHLGPAD